MTKTTECECGQRVHAKCRLCGITELHGGEWYPALGIIEISYDDPDESYIINGDDDVDPHCQPCDKKITDFIDSLRPARAA